MSFSTILSAVIEGLEVAFIHVEADISNGLPVLKIRDLSIRQSGLL